VVDRCYNYVLLHSSHLCRSYTQNYLGADKSLARSPCRCILFDVENISFDAVLVIYIYIYSANIPRIMTINEIHKHQNLRLL